MVSVKVFPFLVNLVTASALIDMLMQDNICLALIEFRASLRNDLIGLIKFCVAHFPRRYIQCCTKDGVALPLPGPRSIDLK